METLGGHYAWLGIGITIAVLGTMVAFVTAILWADDGFDWYRPLLLLVALALIPIGIVTSVRQSWEVSRITCDRQARNYDTAGRWTKALGCYLRDDSGRYIPVDSYITTRVETHREG